MVKSRIPASLWLPLAATFVASATAANFNDWQSRSIYQVVTDRFAKDIDDGGPCDSSARQYCNGTWKGIINHLDYIQGMGFDAVWISPHIANIEGTTPYGQAYHGYWPLDYNAVNTHFGTADDLKALSDALHKRGMYLMLDVIANHVAATSLPPALSFSGYTPFNTQADYHPFCWVEDYQNQTQVEQCWVGDDKLVLADLNTEDPQIAQQQYDWVANAVKTYNADGIRMDTVKHIRQDFWPQYTKSAGVFSIGEILDDRANYTGSYTNYMDTVFNYPQWFKLKTAFMNPQADMNALVQSFKDTQQYFKNGAMSTVAFSENHDNARLPAVIMDPILVKSIITWTFGGDAIPVLYYGQEAGYNGVEDPMNREALWFTSYSTSVVLYKYITTLNAARKMAIASSPKFLSTAAKLASSTEHHIALSKYPMLTVLTNIGTNSTATSWTINDSGFKGGEKIVDVTSPTCDVVTVGNDGSVAVTFNAGQPKVYLATTAMNAGGPCGARAEQKTESSAMSFKSSLPGVAAALLLSAAAAFF